MIDKIISFINKYKIKKQLRVLKVQLKRCYRDLGREAITQSKDLVATINSAIFQINEEYIKLEKEYFAKEKEQKEKESELRFYKNNFEERYFEINNKLKFAKKKLKDLKSESFYSNQKLKLRLKKEDEMLKKYQILTMFQDKDMSKTINNLQQFIFGNTQKQEDLNSQIFTYTKDIERLKREKIINIEKVTSPLKVIKKDMKTLKEKIREREEEREFLLINIGMKLFQQDNLPESLNPQKDQIHKFKENIHKIESCIITP